MKKIILILPLFFASFINLYAQWAKTYGVGSSNSGYSIQQTSDGGYILIGDTGMFGTQSSDIWVLKLSSTGKIEWQKAYGGYSYDSGHFIQQTNDGGYILIGDTFSFGAGGQDILVLKLSSTGEIEWQKAYGGYSYDSGHSIQQTSDGGYILIGDTASFGGFQDICVLKLSSAGNIEWQKAYGGNSYSSGHSIQQTSDGGYILIGDTFSYGAGSYYDICVLKLSSTGEIEWQKAYGGNSHYYGSSIQQTNDGRYILIGDTFSFGAGGQDILVLKLSSTGEIEWQRIYGGNYYDSGSSIQQTSDGGYILIGDTLSFGAGEKDIFVLKLSSNGEIIPSCHCVGISNATITNSYAYPQNTAINPQNTNTVPLVTNVSPQDSDAVVNTICSTQKFILTISASSGGTTNPASDTYNCYEGMEVTISALPDSGYAFSGWSGDVSGTENPLTVVMDKDKSITANFIRQYNLTIAAGKGGTTYPLPGSYVYRVITEVNITAIPEPDYRFSGWTGDALQGHENDNPLVLSMDKDKSITANFVRTYRLTIITGKGGTSEPAPGTYSYDSGTIVTIKAIPESGYQFSGWSVDASGKDNPITVTIDKDKSILAAFASLNEEEKAWELNCFIATAAYGSPLHPYVEILRNFRDRFLMPRKLGRMLVRIYYRHSPFIANIITKHKALKLVVRVTLLPIIAFSYLMLHLSPITIGIFFAFIFSLSIFIVYFHRKRMKKMS